MYQNIAGSEITRTGGLNFVSPLSVCAIDNEISISSLNFIGKNTFLDIIAKPQTTVEIYNTDNKVLINKHEIINPNLPEKLSLDWNTYKYHIPKGINNILIKSNKAINLSMTVSSGDIGAAAYFSGFTPSLVITPVGGEASFYQRGFINLKLKKHKKFAKYEWHRNNTFFAETKVPELKNVTQDGDYKVYGIDPSCHEKIKSNTIKLLDPKDISIDDIQDLYVDNLEDAIIDGSSSVLLNLNYVFDKAELVQESVPIMEEVIATLKKYKDVKIKILAHTDCLGSNEYNLSLSQRRADYVMNHMIKEGISADRLEAVGMGETSPLKMVNCDCSKSKCTKSQLALNRRSEFIIIK